MKQGIFLQGIEINDLKNFIKEAIVEISNSSIQETPEEPAFYSKQEVADLLGIHANTVDNLRKDGALKFSRIRGSLRISKSDFQKYLANSKKAI